MCTLSTSSCADAENFTDRTDKKSTDVSKLWKCCGIGLVTSAVAFLVYYLFPKKLPDNNKDTITVYLFGSPSTDKYNKVNKLTGATLKQEKHLV